MLDNQDEQSDLFRSMVATVREPLVVLDAAMRVLLANDSFYRNFRVAEGETVGRRLYDLGNGQWDIPALRELLEVILPTRNPFEGFRVEHDFPHIGPRSMLLNARKLESLDLILLAVEDVTERHLAEAKGLEVAEKYKLMVDSVSDYAIFMLDAGARVKTWSEACERVTGWRAEEVVGRHFGIFHTPEDQRAGKPERGVEVASSEGGYEVEDVRVRNDGSRYWARASLTPIRRDGELVGFAKVLQNIDDRQRAELLTKAVTDNATTAIFLMDPEGVCTFLNPAAEAMTGFTSAEMVGRVFHDLTHHTRPDGTPYPLHECEIARAVWGHEPVRDHEDVFVRKDGTYFPVRCAASPILKDGTLVGIVFEVRDITGEKRAEEGLREQTRIAEALHRLGVLVAAELDLDRLVQVVTDEATRLTDARFGAFFYNVPDGRGGAYTLYTISGVPREAFSRFPMPRATDLFGPTFRNEGVVRLDDVTQDPRFGSNAPHHGMPEGHLPVRSYLAVSVVSRTGEVLGGLFFGHPEPGVFAEADERLVVGIAAQAAVAIDNARLYRDLREADRSKGELLASLRDSEGRFRTMAESIPQLAWMARPDGHIYWYNRRWHEYTGTTPEEMEGWGWQKVHDPEVLPSVLERWEASISSGEPFDMVFPLMGADGRFRPFLTRVMPVRGEDGQIAHWFGTNTDISERVAMEEELKESDRRKDKFLATLAHELRNPLAPIRTALHLMGEPCDDGRDFEAERAMAERQLAHLARLVDDLMDVARINQGTVELRKEALDLATLIRRAVEVNRTPVEERRHELVVSLPPGPVRLEGDPTRLEQVLTNLLSNAVKYTDPGGRIELSAEAKGDEVVLRVRDTGSGMAPDVLPQVFDMFVQAERRLRRSQGGLGIGLGLVKSLVELHGGTVTAHSDGPGTGSEFIVRLPILTGTKAQAEDSPRASSQDRPTGLPSRRILVVDDNEDAANSLARFLRRLYGQQVEVAYDGPAALEAALAFRPDVILLDIGLPGLSGFEVAERLRCRAEFLGTLIVAVTGWGREDDRRRSKEVGIDLHLVKPVDPTALRGLIASEAR